MVYLLCLIFLVGVVHQSTVTVTSLSPTPRAPPLPRLYVGVGHGGGVLGMLHLLPRREAGRRQPEQAPMTTILLSSSSPPWWRTNREVLCQGGSKTTVSSPSASASARCLGKHATDAAAVSDAEVGEGKGWCSRRRRTTTTCR